MEEKTLAAWEVKSKEKDIALSVALKLGNYIKENMKEVKVIYTRDSDVFVELDERTIIANRNKADLFISVHCNAADNKAVFGSETYTIGMHKTDGNLDVAMRENAVILKEDNHKEKYQFDPYSIISYIKMSNFQSNNQTKSIDFANKVQKQFEERVNRENRGVKQSGFLVLWKTAMPAALIEIGFLTNANEENYLKTDDGQSYIASGIYRAFKEYKNEVSVK